MKIIKETRKSVVQVVADLTKSVVKYDFSVLHIHNIHEALNKKGVDFANQCQILEVCNPVYANVVLTEDMDLNMVLPCRIAVFEKNGRNYIGTLSPRALLEQFSDSAMLSMLAREVEEKLLSAIEEVR